MKTPPSTARTSVRSPAVRLRAEIEAAIAEGLDCEDMPLRLTLGDVSRLKTDSNLAVSDISFVGGEMRFLGVRVEQGGVPASVLNRP